MGAAVHGADLRQTRVLEPLVTALERYVAAVASNEAQETVASCEALLEARLAVLQTLVEQGWRPPERVTDALELDRAVAHLDLGGASVFEESAQQGEGAVER